MEHATFTITQFARQRVLMVGFLFRSVGWSVDPFLCIAVFFGVFFGTTAKMDILIALLCSLSVDNRLFAIFQLNAQPDTNTFNERTNEQRTYTYRPSQKQFIFSKPNRPTDHILLEYFTEIIYVFILPQRDLDAQSELHKVVIK